MKEIKLLFRKDLLILWNNIKLILKNPLRLIPYAAIVGYFFFIYWLRFDNFDGEKAPEMPEMEGIPQVDFAMQNIIGAVTLLGLGLLIYQLYRATKIMSVFSKWQTSTCCLLVR